MATTKLDKAIELLKNLNKIDMPDGSEVTLKAWPTLNEKGLDKLLVEVEYDKQLPDDVEFHSYIKGNVKNLIKWKEDDDFEFGFKFTKRF